MLALPPVASWFAIDWPADDASVFEGGTVLRDGSGNVLRVVLGKGETDCRPTYVADPSDWVVKALVASEDGTFWSHCGVRPLSALRAAFQNIACGRRVSGASTLTMQAVRLMRPHPKTLWHKFREAVMALKMERERDKVWILSQYLNRAPFGSNYVGVEAAAQGWFGKSAKELGLGDAALLAGMVQAPSRFRPDRRPDRAVKRRDYVLDRLLKLGWATPEEVTAARTVLPDVSTVPRPFKAPHFCDWVRSRLGDCGGKPAEIVTTLDPNLQDTVSAATCRAAAAGGYSVAALVMRVETGDVLALACSGDYFADRDGQVNTALAARPAGSTLKPFLAALAMEQGRVTPETRLADVPRSYKGYRPANFDANHRGMVSLRDALILSLNIPFVHLLKDVGVGDFGVTLRTLGFSHLGDPDESYGLGMAIGNVEVSLAELVAAYAAVARGGVWRRPSVVVGETSPTFRVFTEASCYLVSDMLSGTERSSAAFGHIADVPLPRFAWKTGTSSAYRDAWTVAWNPSYVVGVWCGHKSGGFGDKTVVGAKAAAPVALGIARSLYPQGNAPWFAVPKGVGRRSVCRKTGLPRGACCPETEEGRFLVGLSDSRPCQVHVRAATGEVIERLDPGVAAFAGRKARQLQIARPEDGAVFELVDGMGQQKVVCRPTGNPAGERLWWFVDGIAAGCTRGLSPLVVDMTPGRHEVTCANEEGLSAATGFEVK